MQDLLELGSAPYDEQCVQVSKDKDYLLEMRIECARYKRQLEKQFTDRPATVWFVIKSFPHNSGSYYEVCVSCDTEDAESVKYVQYIEDNLPAKWKEKDNV